MKNKLLLSVLIFNITSSTILSQDWIDKVHTIYSSSSRLHSPVFMKRVIPYYYMGDKIDFLIIEDSNSTSLFKTANINGFEIKPTVFQTIFSRPAPIGKVQFIGIFDDNNTPQHQFLFWEEGSGQEQQIMYSHFGKDSIWESPKFLSPSSYKQHELISTQINTSEYPPQSSFAVAWNENDSLTIINFSNDTILTKIRIATEAVSDSIHPAITDGVIAWETQNPKQMLRFARFKTEPILSDTISGSQYGSNPTFLIPSFLSFLGNTIFWMKTINGVGNILATNIDELSAYPLLLPQEVTNDSIGTNLPISVSLSPVITKSSTSAFLYYNYLVYIRIQNDSNAFVRQKCLSSDCRREFWTNNLITEIDVLPGLFVYSMWIEKIDGMYYVKQHADYAWSDDVKETPSLPTNFLLEQNYPNPFNSSTIIKYQIPTSGLVNITVYDILGRKIAVLLNEYKDVGYHQYHWNAVNLPSGIYFYKISFNGSSSIKKMLLIK